MNPAADTAISRLVRAVEIDSIRLVRAEVWSRIRSPKEAAPHQVDVSWSGELERHEGRHFRIHASLRFEVRQRTKKQALVRIEVQHELAYHLPEGLSIDGPQLDHFAKVNAIYNVWPYWREFIESTMQRFALPPFTLPLLKVGRANPAPPMGRPMPKVPAVAKSNPASSR